MNSESISLHVRLARWGAWLPPYFFVLAMIISFQLTVTHGLHLHQTSSSVSVQLYPVYQELREEYRALPAVGAL